MKHSIRRHRILHRFTTRKYEQEASVTVHEGRQRKTPVDFQLWSQIGTLAFLTRERTCIPFPLRVPKIVLKCVHASEAGNSNDFSDAVHKGI